MAGVSILWTDENFRPPMAPPGPTQEVGKNVRFFEPRKGSEYCKQRIPGSQGHRTSPDEQLTACACRGHSSSVTAQYPSAHRTWREAGHASADPARLVLSRTFPGTADALAAPPITGVVKTGRTGVVMTGPGVAVARVFGEGPGAEVHPAAKPPAARSMRRTKTGTYRFILLHGTEMV